MAEIRYLAHHGIKGMRWGVRRYQNPDGSLTPEGRKHYYNVSPPSKQSDAITRGATVGAIGGGVGAGAIGAVAGAAAGAAAGYAKYRIQKRSFSKAQSKIKADNERLDKEYEQSEEHKSYLKKLKKEGARLNSGGADSFRKYENNASIRAFAEVDAHKTDFAKKHGLSTPKAYHEYMKKALKNFNEHDIDQIVYQHMDDSFELLERGYISKSTFNKLYDAQLAIDAYDFSNYGDDGWVEYWHDIDKHN